MSDNKEELHTFESFACRECREKTVSVYIKEKNGKHECITCYENE